MSATSAPSAASVSAIARPMPRLAPVTRARAPFRPRSMRRTLWAGDDLERLRHPALGQAVHLCVVAEEAAYEVVKALDVLDLAHMRAERGELAVDDVSDVHRMVRVRVRHDPH